MGKTSEGVVQHRPGKGNLKWETPAQRPPQERGEHSSRWTENLGYDPYQQSGELDHPRDDWTTTETPPLSRTNDQRPPRPVPTNSKVTVRRRNRETTQEPNASEVPPTAGGVSSIGPTTDPNQLMQLLTLSIQNQQLMAENSAREQQKISRLLTQQKVTNYPKMEQGADIIAFLSGFETHMDNFEVHPDQYRKYLIPALNEEGHQAIELLTTEEKADYSILRAKLLESL